VQVQDAGRRPGCRVVLPVELLGRGERPPEEFSRPEVADVLIEAYTGSGAPA